MRKRKIQIFLSSTYEDLIDHRLTAMEAILAAGHIPAAMEQFSPGDETAWEKIKSWINESDAFILILGGRYGSVEPTSGKSYVQLEYEYAVEKKKPFFAIIVAPTHHEERVREYGLKVDERDNAAKYKEFKALVTQRLSAFWSDKRDIKTAIFQKLPEWAQRDDLTGWVRADEAASPAVMNELARLSEENRELRAQVSRQKETFEGLEFEELVRLLTEREISEQDSSMFKGFVQKTGVNARNLMDLFELIFSAVVTGRKAYDSRLEDLLNELVGFGLLTVDVVHAESRFKVTETARRFRNQLLKQRRLGAGPT